MVHNMVLSIFILFLDFFCRLGFDTISPPPSLTDASVNYESFFTCSLTKVLKMVMYLGYIAIGGGLRMG